MKKDSNRKVNWIMVQAANTAVRHDGGWPDSAREPRHGKRHQIAITHVANKMLAIIWHMLSTRTPYFTMVKGRYQRTDS